MHVSVCLLMFVLSQLAFGRWWHARGGRNQLHSKWAYSIFKMILRWWQIILTLIWKLFWQKISGFPLQVAAVDNYRRGFGVMFVEYVCPLCVWWPSPASATGPQKRKEEADSGFHLPIIILWQKDGECVFDWSSIRALQRGKIKDSTATESQQGTAAYTRRANHRRSISDVFPFCFPCPSCDRHSVSLFDIQHSNWVRKVEAAAVARMEGQQPSFWTHIKCLIPLTYLVTSESDLSFITIRLSPPSRYNPHPFQSPQFRQIS